jgi:hypothetical protein
VDARNRRMEASFGKDMNGADLMTFLVGEKYGRLIKGKCRAEAIAFILASSK